MRKRRRVWWTDDVTWPIGEGVRVGAVCFRVAVIERADGMPGVVSEWSPILGDALSVEEADELHGAIDEMSRVLLKVLADSTIREQGQSVVRPAGEQH